MAKQRPVPEIKIGDAYFGWNLCFEDPQAVWSFEGIKTLHKTMGRWVPVPGVLHWGQWVIIGKLDGDLLLVAPILFEDLGDFKYKYQNVLDDVERWPFEVYSSRGPALVLMGCCRHMLPADFAGRIASAAIFPWDAKRLRVILAKSLRGENTPPSKLDSIIHVTPRHTMEHITTPLPGPECN